MGSSLDKGRGSNGIADAKAKQGLQRRDEFLAWMYNTIWYVKLLMLFCLCSS